MKWNSNEIAEAIKTAIVKNTLRGRDKYGKEFKLYSTKPFAIPYGAVHNKSKLKQATDTKTKKQGKVNYWKKTSTKGMWITWLDSGYKGYKKTMFGNSKPNLWATGGMIKSFTRLKVIEKGDSGATYNIKTNFGEFKIPIPQEVHITLGWTDKEKAKIAYYNKMKGRDMFGLPQKYLENVVNNMLKK